MTAAAETTTGAEDNSAAGGDEAAAAGDSSSSEEETAENRVLHRNTFGTQPAGVANNAFDLVLKNPANTNVQSWGGKCLALWEAALPSRIEPRTLAYAGAETFDGLLADGGMTVTSGVDPSIDRALGLGVAFTAHPREDRVAGRFIGWSWAAPLEESWQASPRRRRRLRPCQQQRLRRQLARASLAAIV